MAQQHLSKNTVFLTLLSLVNTVSGAHTVLYYGQQNGKNISCIRGTGGGFKTSPIKDLTSQDMTCGLNPVTSAPAQCYADAGSTLNFIYGDTKGPQATIVTENANYAGPCNVYVAGINDFAMAAPTQGWWKFQEGVWDSKNKWCTTKLAAENGLFSVTIPNNIPNGQYLIRIEMGSVVEADVLYSQNNTRGLQLFVYCAEVVVANGNSVFPPSGGVNIPGYLTDNSAGVKFDANNNGTNSISNTNVLLKLNSMASLAFF
jgi:hypothetical protein